MCKYDWKSAYYVSALHGLYQTSNFIRRLTTITSALARPLSILRQSLKPILPQVKWGATPHNLMLPTPIT